MVLLGAIIGEDALQNKDKAIWSAEVAPPQYTPDELAKEPDARQTAGPIAVSDLWMNRGRRSRRTNLAR
jgi:hypothetical protein